MARGEPFGDLMLARDSLLIARDLLVAAPKLHLVPGGDGATEEDDAADELQAGAANIVLRDESFLACGEPCFVVLDRSASPTSSRPTSPTTNSRGLINIRPEPESLTRDKCPGSAFWLRTAAG